jgi:aspartyl-tRNA(Asn)/glutamyl-tRNA(Gln) amidotransferase subunit A
MQKSDPGAWEDPIGEHWRRLGVSAADACSALLDRISEVNGQIGAFTDVLRETALFEARRVDALVEDGRPTGRLGGWPLAVKDNIDTVPARCSAGLPFLADRRPQTDAKVVSQLREEGAVIVGVTNTDSGAFGVTSPEVVNPRHPDLIAGGSSGGSAAAVAAGLCIAALGTDTGGSVRIPAACCGVMGFKPTRSRISTLGVRPLASSFDHVGILSDRVDRIRAVYEVLDTAPGEAREGGGQGSAVPVVGIPSSFFADAQEEVLQRMSTVAELLRDMGVPVREVMVEPPDEIVQSHLVLSLTEAALAHLDINGRAALEVYPETAREGIRLGRSYTAAEHLLAMRHSSAFIAQIDEVLGAVDFLLLPTLPMSPPRRGTTSVDLDGRPLGVLEALIRYTAVFDQTGHPVIALPLYTGKDQVPGSIQLVGRMNGDHELLDFAERVALLMQLADPAL